MKATSARDTPMMRQYLAIKADHPDAILCYRMGDFYELFLDDAVLVAPLIDITLTSRDKDKTDPVPMCGFPVHAADGYIKRLAELGHRVAICEQVEDPKESGGKRLVKRAVVEVVTPGLVGDPSGLDARREVSVMSVAMRAAGEPVGLAILDASTGDFRATRVEASKGEAIPELVTSELRRVSPREILCDSETREALAAMVEVGLPATVLTQVPATTFDPTLVPVLPEGMSQDPAAPDACAAAALVQYLGTNQPSALEHAPRLRNYHLGDTMVLDEATRTHLELFENNEDRGRSGTLLERLDASATPLGARRVAHWLRYPLLDPGAIRARQEGVAYLAEHDRLRASLREALAPVRDLERILTKAIRPTATPRDLGVLRSSLDALPQVTESLGGAHDLAPGQALPAELTPPTALPEVTSLLWDALIDEPPVVARGSRGANETGYIREGHRPELDALRESAGKGREWIAGLEASERERTGIANLRVKFHPVHGYSLEVSKAQLDKVPDDYTRKQTLANVERFTTEELAEVQGRVMGANERAAALEREILEAVRQEIVAHASEIRVAADAVANIDAIASLAEVARREAWVRPEVHDGETIEISAGRHPVVEAFLAASGDAGFVPNDTSLDPEDAQILLLTGPNMSGKSTYLRQVALVVLMAQTGSWVPAESASIGIVDRIFTRVGASDRLARGESTFMVEMRETAEILRGATRASLLILDEIGRGTSTFDGLSIAWAVLEHLHDTPGLHARTLFATHYHELTDLARTRSRVRNGHFEAREWKDEVVFLRRLVTGGASRSYGIAVAQLAGLPGSVIERAKQILANLEGDELDPEGAPRLARRATSDSSDNPAVHDEGPPDQLTLALASPAPDLPPDPRPPEEEAVLDALREVDPNATAPIDALVLLGRLHAQLSGRGGT
ncbi:MAG: DNA mismatch repair protein MutS [Myxococcota bacterium]|nr:DNA mismatch repair protein MutS [Myxococcota bacterium]